MTNSRFSILNFKYTLPIILIIAILIIDQIIKIKVKTSMYLGEEIPVFGNWFIIHFTENEGMAFGMKFFGKYGKLILSLFRIVAVSFIGIYLFSRIKKNEKKIITFSIALIFAGAVGNIIDSCFYGILFNESIYNMAQFLPESGGYAPFLYGKVVDMFYFPLFTIQIGGGSYTFFSFIFNFADAAVTVGVFMLLFHFLFKKSENPAK